MTWAPGRSFVFMVAHGERIAAWVVVVGLLALCGYYVGVKGDRRSAFNRWRPQLQALVAGEDAYRRFAFPTPPIMALVLTPFAILPAKVGMTAWFVVKAGLTILAFRLWRRMLEQAVGPMPGWLLAAALALALGPIVGDLLHGNVNLWILFLITLGIGEYRRGNDVACGLWLSLAAACKVTPALLLVYFLWRRAWRVAAAGAVGLLLWLFLVPGLALGMERNLTLLSHWAEAMVWPYLRDGRIEADARNQSVPGLLTRLLTATPAFDTDDGASTPTFVNLLSMDAATNRQIVRGVNLAILLGAAVVLRRAAPRASLAWLHEVCLVLLVMLLLSERSWKHHYVALLPSMLTLLATWWHWRGDPARAVGRRFIAAAVALATLSMTAAAQDFATPILGATAHDYWQAYGGYVWAAALLVAAHGTAMKGRIKATVLHQAALPAASRPCSTASSS